MKQDIYIGTYSLPIQFGTGQILIGKGKGIYRFEFDSENPGLVLKNVTEGTDNASFLTVNQRGGSLYAVNELKEFEGAATGAVSAYTIKPDGTMTLMNRLATGGTDPCHIVLSPDEQHVIVSNYSGGSVSVFPVLPDSSLGEREQFIQYQGKSADPVRQLGPHAHSATFSRNAKYVYICDLGTDRVRVYSWGGSTPLCAAGEFAASPGAGPRLIVFGADGRYGYVVNEIEWTITVAAADRQTGELQEIQKISAIPEGAALEDNLCADVHVTPDGRYLYASNRGLDNIAIFRIDGETGKLTPVGFTPCGGQIPRSFTLDETGRFLICANQDSDNIVLFEIDSKTGGLKKIAEAYVPTPVCVRAFEQPSV